MREENILWVRSLLAVYRQAATDAARDDISAAARRQVAEDLARVHGLFAAHERIDSLWQEAFGGTSEGMRAALSPLIEALLLCDVGSPMRALVEFAAEEMELLFEEFEEE